jgi:hypothetical protein
VDSQLSIWISNPLWKNLFFKNCLYDSVESKCYIDLFLFDIVGISDF